MFQDMARRAQETPKWFRKTIRGPTRHQNAPAGGFRRLWEARPRSHKRHQEALMRAGNLGQPQEASQNPKRIQENSRGTQEVPRGPRKPQDGSGSLRRPQDTAGGPRRPNRHQDAPGDHRRHQEAHNPGTPRLPQEALEAPGHPNTPHDAPAGPKRPRRPHQATASAKRTVRTQSCFEHGGVGLWSGCRGVRARSRGCVLAADRPDRRPQPECGTGDA